jgi:hypothetical protein
MERRRRSKSPLSLLLRGRGVSNVTLSLPRERGGVRVPDVFTNYPG